MKSCTINSVSHGRKSTQVTVTIGEGRNKRSVTRHIHHVGSEWVGLNPDERAIPLNERYEAELRKAKIDLADATSTLKSLQKRLNDELAPVVHGGDNLPDEDKVEDLRNAIDATKLKVYTAEALVDDAESKRAIVRRELPLEVEFFGVGLTY